LYRLVSRLVKQAFKVSKELPTYMSLVTRLLGR
jgi:hypothetical protein